MNALFKPWSNTLARLSLAAVALGGGGAIGGMLLYVRSPLFTQQNDPIEQPVQFDHRHHVGEVGIDCRYCHTQVEKAASAGYPPTSLCLNCHAQIWNKSPKLAPVREAFFTNTPIQWEKVYKLPHYVYFNHSIHVAKGVGCATCHGRVDTMAAIEKIPSLSMGWCLECHRNPEKFLRPKDEITNLKWEAPTDEASVVRELIQHGVAKDAGEVRALAIKGATKDILTGQRLQGAAVEPTEAQRQLALNADPKLEFGLALKGKYDVHTRQSCSTCHR